MSWRVPSSCRSFSSSGLQYTAKRPTKQPTLHPTSAALDVQQESCPGLRCCVLQGTSVPHSVSHDGVCHPGLSAVTRALHPPQTSEEQKADVESVSLSSHILCYDSARQPVSEVHTCQLQSGDWSNHPLLYSNLCSHAPRWEHYVMLEPASQ